MGGMSHDNVHGLVLALSSSIFIGSSFIIKKKGLKKAGATGIRAGSGGYSYLFEPWWWAGMVTRNSPPKEKAQEQKCKWRMTALLPEVANFAAYAFAPAILVTPLGALSIIFSAVLAHFILEEKLHIFGVVGCVLCLVGSTTIVLHAPQERKIESVKEVWNFYMMDVGAALDSGWSREVGDAGKGMSEMARVVQGLVSVDYFLEERINHIEPTGSLLKRCCLLDKQSTAVNAETQRCCILNSRSINSLLKSRVHSELKQFQSISEHRLVVKWDQGFIVSLLFVSAEDSLLGRVLDSLFYCLYLRGFGSGSCPNFPVMSVKAVGIALKLTFLGMNQFIFFETWFFTVFVIACCLLQLNYLNKALDTFNTAVISPVYYVMFTTLTILASMIMFKDWDHQNATQIVTELCGFVTILSGTFLLHKTKDMGGDLVCPPPLGFHALHSVTYVGFPDDPKQPYVLRKCLAHVLPLVRQSS
ncbi:hypothetical protein RJ639_009164 [Escallonia herrerae]|uniref:Probable magnesium transporter n=1 Tax=Escallonia herrerae TaxID=1293975 RepID=A0AA89AW36_9ASTE|nr:hypothetical protein RJ639_009164 [Escallonia herrerae]